MSVSTPPMLLAKASGIMSLEGFTPAVFDMASTMGRSSATVPVLLTKAATSAVTSSTRKKRRFSLVPARRSRRPLMVLASPVWNTAPPTTKRPIMMTTAELENPDRASFGEMTPVSSRAAMEQRATMSERTLFMTKATMVATNVKTVIPACTSGAASQADREKSGSIILTRYQMG